MFRALHKFIYTIDLCSFMLTRDMFILPDCLKEQRASGVLDTPEQVKAAGEEYRRKTEPAIAEINQAWRTAMEKYAKNPVRLDA